MRKWLPFAFCTTLLTGCVTSFEETTLVRVRRPSSVSVDVRTPTGSQRLLEVDEPPREVELPASRPPFTELIRYAVVVRHASGAVTLTCPSCGGVTERTVVPLEGSSIEITGGPSDTLVWHPNALQMRFGSPGLFRCRRGGGDCPREAVALWLATPLTNVVEVRHRTRAGDRTGPWAATLFGSVFFAGGAFLAVATSVSEGHVDGSVMVIGGSFVALGGFFLGTGLRSLLVEDTERTLYRVP